MKRLIAAGILIAVVAAMAVSSRLITEHFYDELSALLENCKQEYIEGDKKTAARKAAEFEEHWDEVRFYLAAFVDRETMENIEASVSRIGSFSQVQDDNMFISECELAEMLLHHMLETEQLTLMSIL